MDLKYYKDKESCLFDTYSKYDIAIESGKGAELIASDGSALIDFTSGIGVNSIGYGDPDWVKAVSEQAAKLAHISNYYYTSKTLELAEKLTQMTNYSKVFLSNSGAEANECAIKLARKYSFDKYGKGRHNIVTLKNSFHGRTVTTVSATGQDEFHNFFFPFTEGFVYADMEDGTEKTVQMLDETVCAVLIEPIQGEGGVIPLDVEFVKTLYTAAKKKDILIIFDEVQTGIGRTGKLLAGEHFNLKADIVTLAKGLGGGLPIGACLCDEKIDKVMNISAHGSTFGGNPIACAGAYVVLEKLSDKAMMDSIEKKGKLIKETVEAWKLPSIKEVRGKGLMVGIELTAASPKKAAQECIKEGLLVLTAGKNAVRLLPPLTISEKLLVKGLQILKKVLSEL